MILFLLFVKNVLRQIDPHDLFEDEELAAKQINIMCEIEESLTEDDLESRGIPRDYLNLAKGFVEYGISRMEGGG